MTPAQTLVALERAIGPVALRQFRIEWLNQWPTATDRRLRKMLAGRVPANAPLPSLADLWPIEEQPDDGPKPGRKRKVAAQ